MDESALTIQIGWLGKASFTYTETAPVSYDLFLTHINWGAPGASASRTGTGIANDTLCLDCTGECWAPSGTHRLQIYANHCGQRRKPTHPALTVLPSRKLSRTTCLLNSRGTPVQLHQPACRPVQHSLHLVPALLPVPCCCSEWPKKDGAAGGQALSSLDVGAMPCPVASTLRAPANSSGLCLCACKLPHCHFQTLAHVGAEPPC